MSTISIKPPQLPAWLKPALAQWMAQVGGREIGGKQIGGENASLAQSIGISDPHATGGHYAAIALAHSLLCLKPNTDGAACGQCSACALLKAGNHTDLMTLLPESMQADFTPEKDKKPSKTIKIDQVRAIEAQLFKSAQHGGRKVVLIYPAQALGDVPANAILKTLEEPPAGVYMILVSQHWEQVLATLRSRCIVTALSAPSAEQKTAWLAAQGVEHSARWLELAAGKVDRASEMATDPQWMPLLKLMPYLVSGAQIDALGLAADMSRYELKRVIEGLQLWMHDLLALSMHAPAVFFAKQAQGMANMLHSLDQAKAFDFVVQLNTLGRMAEHPLNARAQVEAVLLEYQSMFKAR